MIQIAQQSANKRQPQPYVRIMLMKMSVSSAIEKFRNRSDALLKEPKQLH